ncbi:unnamed protein product [Phytophthora fragariaefolia]|uniref:Unnamed protein product n=1 Tax=Phytophthora fragariaefolia TaxID=1490495 RepID=A0A9W6YBW7_9STRA|nr:unnamed protein product [Phytophthora fragariaefolia]
MLESCIEKKVIPLPWEKIIEEVSAKRHSRGKKDISRASVIATMTAKEAAGILVEAIDINAPDETIKYGFQSFGEGFIEDSSLRQANEADAKISETLQRRRSSIRSLKNISTPSTMTESTDGTVPSERNSSTDTNSETASVASSCGPHCDKTLTNLLFIVESMAGSLARLQQDVSDLRKRDSRCRRCECCEPHYNLATQRALNSSPGVNVDSVVNITKFHYQTTRKPSLVASQAPLNKRLNKRLSHRSSDSKIPHGFLRKIKSKIQENNPDETSPKRENKVARPTQTPRTEVVVISTTNEVSPDPQVDRYPPSLSGRSKAARNSTLLDILWKRSNTIGDLLKHTDEERQAARLRRQIRTRRSLPSEPGTGLEDGNDDAPVQAIPGDTSSNDDELWS